MYIIKLLSHDIDMKHSEDLALLIVNRLSAYNQINWSPVLLQNSHQSITAHLY